jgi:hypothetical protein
MIIKRETYSSTILSTTNPKPICRGLNPRLLDEKRDTKPLMEWGLFVELEAVMVER